MTLLVVILATTLGFSFLCSLLEGFILSVTTAEVEAFKHKHPFLGERLERRKNDIERTTAAILTLNTLANTSGSAAAGYLAGELFGSEGVAILTALLTLVLLLFCEILPKNIGVLFRKPLATLLTWALEVVVFFLGPVASLCKSLIRLLLPPRARATEADREQEVLMLVNKAHRDGFFSVTEREIIANAIALDERPITALMTPLERITALPANEHVSSVLRHIGSYSRLPVYEGSQIVGLVLRADLLHASALDQHNQTVRSLMKPILRLNSALSPADILQNLLKNRQELCIIEGPTGQILGLITMEDIIANLLGHRPTQKS